VDQGRLDVGDACALTRGRFAAMRLFGPLFRDRLPGWLLQLAVLAVLVFLVLEAIHNARVNVARLGLEPGFDFLRSEAGFQISQHLIPYGPSSRYIDAVYVAILNTLAVVSVSIVLSTILGLLAALGRLSRNPLLAKISTAYIELFRNVPLLLQIFFWYFTALVLVPRVRDSIELGPALLNNRGLYLPSFSLDAASWWVCVVDVVLVLACLSFALRRQRRPDVRRHVAILGGLFFAVAATLHIAVGPAIHWDMPVSRGLSEQGGIPVGPEFLAMALGLSIYNSAFMAEIFRSGMLAIPTGQYEAAATVNLSGLKAWILILMPQTLRLVLPPAIGQYQTLIKASSLAAAIGYPDVMQVVGGTILTQTSRAIEAMAMVILIYMVINLTLSLLINLYNGRVMSRGGA
jgi:general L-amino acid transport system permease protein